MRYELLRDVLTDVQAGIACGARAPNGIVQLRMNNVETSGSIDFSNHIRIPGEIIPPEMFLRSGDVVFNNTNSVELVGKTALFEGFKEPVTFSNHFTRLRTKPDRLHPAYLSLWLQWLWSIKKFESICDRWIGQAAVQRSKIEALEIPCRSIDDQRRIAERLKTQLAAVEEARRAAEEQLREVKKLFPAILEESFKEVADAKTVRLKDIAYIQLGKMLSPKSKTGLSYFPYLRNKNVQWGRIELNDVFQMDFSEAEQKKFALRDGDLLVCEGGEPGRCAIWRGERQDYFYQKALHRIRPISKELVPEYLMYWLWFQGQIGAFEDQNAKTTIAHLPVVRLEQLSLPLPDCKTQSRIAKRLSTQLNEIYAIEESLCRQLSDIEYLPSRLLAQAFGETSCE